MKLYTMLTLLLLYSSIGLGQNNLLQNVSSRETISLNGTWKIIIDPLENGYYNYRYQVRHDGYFKNEKPKTESDLIEYDFDTDLELSVPGDWNTQMEKLYYYEGTIWYKKSFDFNLEENNTTYVHFGAANYDAKVYLNGELLGSHIGGYTPFQFDITNLLKESDNFLVVKVDNKRLKEAVPTVNTDWWNYGGITRSVKLISVPKNHIQDYFLALSKTDPTKIEGWVQLSATNPKEKIEISIPELKKKSTFRTDENGMAHISFTATPQYWSNTDPKLYEVIIQTQTDRISDQIGFRTIETRGSDILLNGKKIFLKGISIHEEAPFKTGRVTTLEECQTLLKWSKDLGCNFVRLAHYPHSEMMVREAEKMGFLVWSEIPVYWTVDFDNNTTYANAAQQLTSMISRDKNRAAVILWSIANETPISEERNKFLSQLAAKAKSMDNTRLITAALDTHSGENGENVIDDPLGEHIDVIGINNYCGWYYEEPENCGAVRWSNPYNKPMIMSEIGAGALYGQHGKKSERWTEEYQDDVFKNNIEMMRNIDFLSGVSPWILMDFRSSRRHLREIQNDFNRKGLISEDGKLKKAFFTLKKYYLEENNSND